MNDFTKEELETLHSCLDQCKFEDGEDDALLEKLEIMIDNYQDEISRHILCRECMRITHE